MYINLLTQLKNAQAVKKEGIKFAYSKMDEKILQILEQNGYIDNFKKLGKGAKKILEINLKYPEDRAAIEGIKLISKPSRKIYIGYNKIRSIRRGYGLVVLSTPKGIFTGKEAKRSIQLIKQALLLRLMAAQEAD